MTQTDATRLTDASRGDEQREQSPAAATRAGYSKPVLQPLGLLRRLTRFTF